MQSGVASQQAAATTGPNPYRPSWVDRLTDSVRRLPFPPWVFYVALGLSLSCLYLMLTLASPPLANSSLSMIDVILFSLLNGFTCAYLLRLVHYLDDSAVSALARYRPVLKGSGADYDVLRYRLTTLPRRPTNIVTLIGALYAFATLVYNSQTYAGDTSTSTMDGFSVPFVVIIVVGVSFNLLIYILAAVMVYHTLHQLRMVSEIYTQHTRINLFEQGPLYVLSGLTARTAIGISIVTYVWFQANSSALAGSELSNAFDSVFLGVLVVVTSVLPLVGAHNLLEREKQSLHDEVGRRMEATTAAMHARADSGEMSDFTALKSVLDGLVVEQTVIEKLRTWPWRAETVRGLGVAFVLPLAIWIIQRVLERLGI